MNSTFKFKLIQALNKKNGNKGFTLIELLVVVIIIGVLAAIALPNLLNQVAKGRQAEARNNLGTINRAQQAYRLEAAEFGTFSTTAADNDLPVSLTTTYYTYPNSLGGGSAVGANHAAIPAADYTNDILEYESAVGQKNDGTFSAIICEQTTNPSANAIDKPGTWSAAGTADAIATCAGGGKEIK
jgi:type IV pilus assembly protein PilA